MSNEVQLVSALKGIVGETNVLHDPDQLKAFAVDGVAPRAVVSPGSVEEVAKVMAYASGEKLAVCPRGNGTKMAMGGSPTSSTWSCRCSGSTGSPSTTCRT